MYDLRVRHLQAQCRLLQILKSTPDRGLLFIKKGKEIHVRKFIHMLTIQDQSQMGINSDGNQLLVIVCSWVET